jgi:2-amino-4-hydroxy-6-hydroxymethyldihydropteridine diphosphokinase
MKRILNYLKNKQKKRIIFGLGSNLGDKESYLTEALRSLENQLFLTNIKKSTIFKNPALLLPSSPAEWNQEFFNIAVSADINLEKFPPLTILEIVKKIEKEVGRQERDKWAPREIDIDILFIESCAVNIPHKLIIPHYDLVNRDFFLQTIKEIEPQFLRKYLKEKI